jgi:hypothetical protein
MDKKKIIIVSISVVSLILISIITLFLLNKGTEVSEESEKEPELTEPQKLAESTPGVSFVDGKLGDDKEGTVDKEGNIIDKEGTVTDKEGNVIDKEGTVTDKEGTVDKEPINTEVKVVDNKENNTTVITGGGLTIVAPNSSAPPKIKGSETVKEKIPAISVIPVRKPPTKEQQAVINEPMKKVSEIYKGYEILNAVLLDKGSEGVEIEKNGVIKLGYYSFNGENKLYVTDFSNTDELIKAAKATEALGSGLTEKEVLILFDRVKKNDGFEVIEKNVTAYFDGSKFVLSW